MIRYALFMATLLCFFSPELAAMEITFHGQAAVDDQLIRLGDIAAFSENNSTATALSSQVVGQAPPPGEKITLKASQLVTYLQSTIPIPDNIIWQGAGIITVTRRGITIGPGRVLDIIAEFIAQNEKNLPKAEFHFVPKSLPMPFTIPTGNISHQVIPSDPAILGSSRFSIIFKVDDKVAKNMSVRGKLEAIGDVVVAAQPLRRGTILRPEHLVIRKMDLSRLNNVGTRLEGFIGKRLTRSLRADSPIQTTMVAALPVIHRGERVTIIVQSGALQVTASGLSHNDGKMGEMIRVQNISSQKLIYGRVAAPGLVEVIL